MKPDISNSTGSAGNKKITTREFSEIIALKCLSRSSGSWEFDTQTNNLLKKVMTSTITTKTMTGIQNIFKNLITTSLFLLFLTCYTHAQDSTEIYFNSAGWGDTTCTINGIVIKTNSDWNGVYNNGLIFGGTVSIDITSSTKPVYGIKIRIADGCYRCSKLYFFQNTTDTLKYEELHLTYNTDIIIGPDITPDIDSVRYFSYEGQVFYIKLFHVPDQFCIDDDGICGTGCDYTNDNDCPVPCQDNDGQCPAGCDYTTDNDCPVPCIDDDGICGTGCDHTNDNDCPVPCVDCDGICGDGCNHSNDNDCPDLCINYDGICPDGCDYLHDNDCPVPCIDDDGMCGTGCNHTNDNDCEITCLDNDGLCPDGCDYTTDNDCPAPCINDDGQCGTGCDYTSDNDCPIPCADDDGICGTGCNYINDNDCPVPCQDDDGICPAGCDASNDNDCPSGIDGLVAYYPFNGNADDESGNNYDGTVNGATLVDDKNGVANSAYYFTGGQNIKIGQIGALNFNPQSDAFTIMAWIKTSQGGYITSKSYDNYNSRQYALYIYNGTLQAVVGGTISNSNVNVNDDTWHHVVMVLPNSGEGVFYIDGIEDNDPIRRGTYTSDADVLIGARRGIDNSTTGFGFTGTIDEVRVYNRALSDGEIEALYNESLSSINVYTLK